MKNKNEIVWVVGISEKKQPIDWMHKKTVIAVTINGALLKAKRLCERGQFVSYVAAKAEVDA